jgi:Xaa-Pro aminopeptidase
MSHAPSAALERRHRIIRQAIAARGLDALIVTSLPNILYLTNFSGSSAIVLIEPESVRFLTDSRYTQVIERGQQTDHACPDLVMDAVTGSYDAALADRIARLRKLRLGFEAQHLTVSRHDWLQRTLSAAGDRAPLWVGTEGLVERPRVRKDECELSILREAGRRLSDVAADVLTIVRRGRSEQAIAADIDWRLRNAGFERPAFETIVASGPNAALPHARPTERMLGEGDLVVLDFGGVYASYCVDLTRTVVVGPATSRARDVHRAVLEAQRQAVAAVRPGASRFAIDAAARRVLDGAGMGAAFGHGTGHGLGIEIHEDPRIVQQRPGVDTRDEAVDAGMVFTVEPGAYFPGWGGVRIEDDIVVTADGSERLTAVTSELVEV